MKKIAGIVMVLAMTIGAFGCQQKKEEQRPATYAPPGAVADRDQSA